MDYEVTVALTLADGDYALPVGVTLAGASWSPNLNNHSAFGQKWSKPHSLPGLRLSEVSRMSLSGGPALDYDNLWDSYKLVQISIMIKDGN